MKTVILIGGNGFIGSECRCQLIKKGYKVITIDKIYPYREVDDTYNSNNHNIYESDVNDLIDYSRIFGYIDGSIVESVICFAAHKDLCDSYEVPFEYYQNNIQAVINSLRLARVTGAKSFIFSSSAAVYNDEGLLSTTEDSPTQAPSPYGYTKLVGERIVKDSCTQFGIPYYNLRYFNPIGATDATYDDSDSLFGCIKRSLETGSGVQVFGDDYNSIDGSCIRDFIDIRDLVSAHIFLMENRSKADSGIYNVGVGKPTTVLQVMQEVKDIYPSFEYSITSRREGDVVGSYADTTKINKLGWSCKYTLEDSIRSILEHKCTEFL